MLGVVDAEERIIRILRASPPGLSITALSRKLHMNRNPVSRYLSILEAQGKLESRIYGRTRIYFLPRKLSTAALLGISTDLVCTFDQNQCLTYANDRFMSFFGLDENKAFYQQISELPSLNHNGLATILKNFQPDKEGTSEIEAEKDGRKYSLKAKIIPTRFEDRTLGTTILLEDVSAEIKQLKNLEFLARTSAELADIGDDVDIYQYICDRVSELEPKAHVMISAIDPEVRQSNARAFSGDKEVTDAIIEYLGDPRLTAFPMDKVPEAWVLLSKGTLIEGPESVYVQAYRFIPEEVCNKFQVKTSVKKNYAMGCTCRGGLYGNVTLRYRKENDIENGETVTAFIRQAGIALQRRHMREKLRKAEEMIKAMKPAAERAVV